MKLIINIILLLIFQLVTTFNPVVEWSCESNAIHVDIKTDSKFYGAAFSTGSRLNCFVNGKNTTLTKMVIPMMPSQNNPCDVKFNQATDMYWVEIEIHKNIYFTMPQDRHFNVTCKKQTTYFDSNKASMDEKQKIASSKRMKNVNFELLANDHSYLSIIDTVIHVKHGESYIAKVSLKKIKCAECFRVTNCKVESEGVSTQLVNAEGCSFNDEFENFIYSNKSATAIIPSFFRLLDFKILKLECKVEICDHPQGCQPRCDNLTLKLSNTQNVAPVKIIFNAIQSLTIHVLDEAASDKFFQNNNMKFYGIFSGLVLIIFACCVAIVFYYIKYRKQIEFINNFFRPLHNYRNSVIDGTAGTNQTSRRSSILRLADHIRRLSTSAPPRASPPPSPLPSLYLMEMTPVPQNFRKKRIPSSSIPPPDAKIVPFNMSSSSPSNAWNETRKTVKINGSNIQNNCIEENVFVS